MEPQGKNDSQPVLPRPPEAEKKLLEQLQILEAELERARVEAKDARDALQSSEEFKTRLVTCSRDCIKVLDLEARLVFMNQGGMQALELCDLDSLLNKPWIDVWDPECHETVRIALETARSGGIGRFVGHFPTAVTKQVRWWDCVITPICDAEGKAQHLLALSRDITDQHLAEQTFRSIVVGTASATG